MAFTGASLLAPRIFASSGSSPAARMVKEEVHVAKARDSQTLTCAGALRRFGVVGTALHGLVGASRVQAGILRRLLYHQVS
jgi:hypothetical protein